MRNLLLALVLGAMVISGCATTNLAPVTSNEFAFEEDERRIWLRSEQEEEKIEESGLIYQDAALEAYLNVIGRKLQPPEVYEKIPFKIKVLKNPCSNAFAYPNGAIYVHTGILSRIDNEAQLATLLAHEMSHATRRHQVREFRGLVNKTAVYASVRTAVGRLPAIGELTSVLGEIGTKAAISGYSKSLETEADMEGIELVIKAGYDPRESPKVFQHLKKELEAEKVEEPFFFGSHPRLQDRIENYENFLKNDKRVKNGIVNSDGYRAKTSRAVLVNASLDLQGGRFQSALRGAEKHISMEPKSAEGYCLVGKIYREQGGKADLRKAEENFRKAISLQNSYPEPFRELGLVYLKQGEKPKAVKAFESYLRLSPKAADREYVKQYISEYK
jgi:predicted Zn-dependent protease